MADNKTLKESAGNAIKAIEAVEKEDAGVPKELAEEIAEKLVNVLSESKKSYTLGHMLDDWLYIPEYFKTQDGKQRHFSKHVKILGHVRALTPDGQSLLRWCHPGRFNRHLRQGFDFIMYDDILDGCAVYKKSTEGYIQNGDLYLMKMSIDGFGRMLRQKLELRKSYEQYHEGEITREAEKHNTKSFRAHEDGSVDFIN